MVKKILVTIILSVALAIIPYYSWVFAAKNSEYAVSQYPDILEILITWFFGAFLIGLILFIIWGAYELVNSFTKK